jgi:hypothetical protein
MQTRMKNRAIIPSETPPPVQTLHSTESRSSF